MIRINSKIKVVFYSIVSMSIFTCLSGSSVVGLLAAPLFLFGFPIGLSIMNQNDNWVEKIQLLTLITYISIPFSFFLQF